MTINRNTKLYKAAERAVTQALRLRRGESFLLVTDEPKLEIAEALAFWAGKSGTETTTYLMTEALRPIEGPTRLFKKMAERASAVAYLLDARIEEKAFRGYMVGAARARSRILMMPGITVDMMERLVAVDYTALDVVTRKIMSALREASDVHVTNADGTDISFSVKGRRWANSNGDLGRKGKHGNLPAGECYTCPVEESFTGRVVIRLIDDKLGRGVLEFAKGRLVKWSGRGVEAIVRHIGGDRSGFIIGEFGVGTNPGARICANMLEAEKAFGTVHFAIGDSYGLGRNSSKHHYDALVDKVTLSAHGRLIAQNGKYLI
ncbi:MAG: aminopeptidase [Candidatus Aminicenantales bacterium]|jgi:leucyl aminopeptidase (aminopeptidase T)